MKFILIDKLVRIEPGKSVRAVKSLSLAEEYLADHFPTFPVLPGVLMVEAMVQSAAWLVRVTRNFSHSVITLSEAKNVTYGNFVAPGDQMEVTCEAIRIDATSSSFKAQCAVGDGVTAKARLTLTHYNLADRHPGWEEEDKKLIDYLHRQFNVLSGPEAVVA